MSGAVHLLPLYSFMACAGETFAFSNSMWTTSATKLHVVCDRSASILKSVTEVPVFCSW